ESLTVGSDEGDEGSQQGASCKTSQVRSIVRAARDSSQHQVVTSKRKNGAESATHHAARRGKFAQSVRRDQCASQTEDRARSARADSVRMPGDACQTSANSRDQIDNTEHPRSVKRFSKRTETPQAPHV